MGCRGRFGLRTPEAVAEKPGRTPSAAGPGLLVMIATSGAGPAVRDAANGGPPITPIGLAVIGCWVSEAQRGPTSALSDWPGIVNGLKTWDATRGPPCIHPPGRRSRSRVMWPATSETGRAGIRGFTELSTRARDASCTCPRITPIDRRSP